MKTKLNKMISRLALAAALAVVLIVGCRCSTSKPVPNPLAGFSFCFDQDPAKLDKAIQSDYQDFMQKLISKEDVDAHYTHSFEDGTGQHAVEIEVPLNGTWWEYVLIYDKSNKRIKTIKYSDGHYRS